MVGQLFTPFDLKRWFLLGFSAFLASLFGGGSNFNFRRIYSSEKGKPAFYDTWGPEIWLIVIGVALVMFLSCLSSSCGWVPAVNSC